jgi:hypothetical protein
MGSSVEGVRSYERAHVPLAVRLVGLALLAVVATAVIGRAALPQRGGVMVQGPLDPRGFRFVSVDQATGKPTRYNPCEAIHYVVNGTRAPAGGLEDVQTALARTSEVSGLNFVYDGPTDEVSTPDRSPYQPARYGERWAPVLFAWATTPLAAPGATANANTTTIGLGGSDLAINDKGDAVFTSGSVTLDATADLHSGFGGQTWGQAILHEVGHVVGLAHVDDPSSVMNPLIGVRPALWGPGDRAGLWQLGMGSGCLEEPSLPRS